MNCWNALMGNQQRNLIFFNKKRSTTILMMRSRAKRLEAEGILYLKRIMI
nr:MAG TPA: hypothetical protein [Caudoviricetes sp.]DAW48124.1 MAG TPA: hypothetical protein [Caudoviricetes sp.]